MVAPTLLYCGLISAMVVTIAITALGIRAVKKTDSASAINFFLMDRPLRGRELVSTLAATNTALALIVFWFSYLGWMYGLGAAVWLSLCWIAGLELFAFYQKKWRDFPGPKPNGELTFETLHEYVAAGKGTWARRFLAFVSISCFILMIAIELTRGMKIIDLRPQQEGVPIKDAIAFFIIFAAGLYSAWGGFKAIVKTDFYQWFFTVIALILCLLISINGIIGHEKIFGLVYSPENFSWSSFSLIPSQPFFIIGSLFSWTFWFFVTMDMWQRAASFRKIGIITIKTRLYIYPWFIFISIVSVCIGLYVRVNAIGKFDIYFPVIDFLQIVFSQEWKFNIIKYVTFSLILTGFISAMISTIDTYLMTICHSIYRDIPDKHNFVNRGGIKFNRLFIAIIMIGITLIIFPLFLIVTHTDFSINALMYLATSAPFILLPAVLIKNKSSSISIIFSVVFGLIGGISLIFYALYKISTAQDIDLERWYNLMYFLPLFNFLFSLTGYVAAYIIKIIFNKKYGDNI